jgi:acetoin utilization deacetylase AcuC-like enzyme
MNNQENKFDLVKTLDLKKNIEPVQNPDNCVEKLPEILETLLKSIKSKEKINFVCYVDDPGCDKHVLVTPQHPESPYRTKVIRIALKEYGLIPLMERVGSIDLKKSDMHLCHDENYIETIINCGRQNKPVTVPSPSQEISMTNIGSLEAIFAAAASAIGAVDAVCARYEADPKNKNLSRYNSKYVRKIFCNIRPPGHHAHHRKGAGFCFVNNVAVAAKYAMRKYSFIKKVLIFDWDLHHGDGTEDIFKNDPNIMYASFHRGGKEGEDRFYPGTGLENNELGNVFNFPIGKTETVESYMDKFNNEFLPKAYDFKPDLVLISAGFDSHKDDSYHELPLDYIHFHEMTKALMKLADTTAHERLVSVLEGGYKVTVLSKCVGVHIATMIDGY